MTALRALLRPWTAPALLSLAVHAAALGGATALRGLVQPPRPEAVIPVELVFTAAPDAAPATATPAPPPPAPAPAAPTAPSQPVLAAVAAPPLIPAAIPVPTAPVVAPRPAPLPPAQPATVTPPTPVPASHAPAPVAEETPPVQPVALTAAPPPLPRRRPKPPSDPTAVAALEAAAAPKAAAPAEPVETRKEASTPVVPAGEGTAKPAPARVPQQASLTPPAQPVPPGWSAPGLANAPPRYPLAARRRGDEGRVVLRVRVTADGRAEAVTVLKSSGHRLLDQAAERAVSRWRFVPGRLAGIPVAASVDVPVTFRLKD